MPDKPDTDRWHNNEPAPGQDTALALDRAVDQQEG